MKITTLAVCLVFLSLGDVTSAQGIGVIPDGVTLSTTPVVSADGRYVRIGVNAGFSTLDGFQTYQVPAAVSGGGSVGFGGAGAVASGGLFGPNASGFASGPVDYSVGTSSFGPSFEAYLQAGTEEFVPVARRRSKSKSVGSLTKNATKPKSRP